MNIEEFVNSYITEHRHNILLNPYNGLIEFAKVFQEKLMGEAVEADVNTYKDLVSGCSWAEFVVDMPSLETDKLGDKVHIIVIKED